MGIRNPSSRDLGLGQLLDEHARRLADAARRAVEVRANEAELVADLDPIIRSAASELFGLDDLVVTAERRHGGRPYDKAYGGVVVEWEWSMDAARRRHGSEQALDYLSLMREDVGADEAFTAVVSDGRQWGFLVQDPRGDPQISLLDPAVEAPDQRFTWAPNSPAACRRFLQLIGSHRQAPLTSAALVGSFGRSSDHAARTLTLLVERLRARDAGDRPDTLFREWRRVLEVVYGDLDDATGELSALIQEVYDVPAGATLGELLFCLHTYFGLVTRLCAVELLAISANEQSTRPSSWAPLDDAELLARLRAVDDGRLPESLQVVNLFEGDVFSWYIDALAASPDLVAAIRDVVDRFNDFAFPRIAFGANPASDILRDLYQELVPRTLRRRLGEFLTPQWLADAAIEEVAAAGRVDVSRARVLDPTCGTGTFLIPFVAARARHLAAASTDEIAERDVEALTRSVVGYDLNPIAVLAARVNYLIALGDIPSRTRRLTLPVWRADSILVPEVARGETDEADPFLAGRAFLALRTSLDRPFPVPVELADAPGLGRLISLMRAGISADQPYSVEEFLDEFDAHMAPFAAERGVEPGSNSWLNQRSVAAGLYALMLDLKSTSRDGVWLTILQNNFAPILEGHFDLVIGNPPWLTWTRLPETWRRAAESLWKDYGLWRVPPDAGTRPRSRSLASSDLAILVYAAAIERYVRDSGTVALLAPRSLISADPGGRGFRQFHLRPHAMDAAASRAIDLQFSVYALSDFSRLNPFSPDASNQPILLIAERGASQSYPVPSSVWRRAEQGVRLRGSWPHVRALLRRIRGGSEPVAGGTSAWSFTAEGAVPLLRGGENAYRFGKGLDTRGTNGVFFVRSIEPAAVDGSILVANIPAAGRNRVPERRGRVASALIWPLLRGKDVSPWIAVPSLRILAPHDTTNLARPLSASELQQRPGQTLGFLRTFRDRLRSRSSYQDFAPTDECYWMLSGPLEHMLSPHIVVVREIQSQPAAALVGQRYAPDLRRTTQPLVEHKLLFCAVASEEEAYYLAGAINSAPIQELLSSFANPIAISPQTLARLPIPTFDPSIHSEVVDAARRVEDAVRRGDADDRRVTEEQLATAFLAVAEASGR